MKPNPYFPVIAAHIEEDEIDALSIV